MQLGNSWEDFNVQGLSVDIDYRAQLTKFGNYRDTVTAMSRSLTSRVAALKAVRHVSSHAGMYKKVSTSIARHGD